MLLWMKDLTAVNYLREISPQKNKTLHTLTTFVTVKTCPA